MRAWNKHGYGSWMLYGHSHGTLPDDPHALSIDVGMDCHDFVPISYEEIKDIMSKKDWSPPFYLSDTQN
jgi:calcineurin-like phosphoesterase family protein